MQMTTLIKCLHYILINQIVQLNYKELVRDNICLEQKKYMQKYFVLLLVYKFI